MFAQIKCLPYTCFWTIQRIIDTQWLLQITVFTRISAATLIKFFAPQMQRFFEGGAYLKIGRDKEIFPICTKTLQ